MHLPDLLHRNARYLRDAEALSDGARRRSHAELERRTVGLATALGELGVAPGDRVAWLAGDRVEALELLFACGVHGATWVPLDPAADEAVLAARLADAEPRAVVVDPGGTHGALAADVGAAALALGSAWDALAADAPEGPPPRRVPTPDAPCALLYDGEPDAPGVPLTHRNLVAAVFAWLYELDLAQAPDRLWLGEPLHRAPGLLHALAALAAGAGLTLTDVAERADPLAALAREEATHARLDARSARRLVERSAGGAPERAPAGLRRVVVDVGALDPRALSRALGGGALELVGRYGPTETAGVGTVVRPGDHGAGRGADTAGRPVLTVAARVVDGAGRELEPGREGELVLRGDAVAPGYWRREAATRARFADGGFRTGARATLGADGGVTLR